MEALENRANHLPMRAIAFTQDFIYTCGSCFAIAQVVKHSNSQSVGQLFSIAGAIALALAALSYFIERRQQAMAAQLANSITVFTAMLLSTLLE